MTSFEEAVENIDGDNEILSLEEFGELFLSNNIGEIVELIARMGGEVSIDELSEESDKSIETIRHNVEILHEYGLLESKDPVKLKNDHLFIEPII
jgi:predicted transcriptional regulator